MCLPTPLTLVCGGSLIIPLLVHQPAYLSIWPAAPSLGSDFMGTTKGNTTDDLQGSRQIDHQLRSPNLHDTNYRKIQYTQNEALRIATGCHKMSSIDHIHTEAEMLKVKEHSELRLHSTWPDAWNQEMYVIPSQGPSLKDR